MQLPQPAVTNTHVPLCPRYTDFYSSFRIVGLWKGLLKVFNTARAFDDKEDVYFLRPVGSSPV